MTKMHRMYPALCVALLTLATFGCAGLSQVPPDEYNLSGDWRLNSAISDSPSLSGLFKQRQGRSGQRAQPQGGGRGGPSPGGGQGGGQGRGQGPGGNNTAAGPGPGRVRVPSLEAKQIEIEQDIESMGMKFDGGNYSDVSWGKRKRGEQTIVAGWKDRDLIIKSSGGPITTEERFVLSSDGQRLTLWIELNGGRDDLKFRRVFEKHRTIPASVRK